ncbi:hypothetical protein PV11_02762 [Exophiala sideris]|uniref:CENP-V/GFA domain-containing protein n=1 Tax=Exophiala sideris TaxID=1016849 RepID=A0A0D1WEG5_9EURO|nr:hypothetical protein PV11_02762 [Exophiala sideris]
MSEHGHCLCNNVEISVSGQPLRAFLCYCPDCQRSAGGPCQAVAAFKAEDVTFLDRKRSGHEDKFVSFTTSELNDSPSLTTYVISGNETASGHPKPKVFCNGCGCTIATVPAKWGGKVVVIRPNLFDRGLSAAPPKEEWFVQERPSFVFGCMGTKVYEKIPDGAG